MKPTLLFRGPIKTRSGYGSHSRDLLESLYQMNMFEVLYQKIQHILIKMHLCYL